MDKIIIELTPLQAAEISNFLTNSSKKIQAQALSRGALDFEEKLLIDSAKVFKSELKQYLNASLYAQILEDYEQAELIHELTINN